MKKFPAIVSDIDGVIVRAKQLIIGSDNVVNNILSQPQIPFFLLTNGGGQLESEKAEGLNKILNSNLQKEHFILSFTPLRPIMGEYRNKLCLICGAGKIREIAEDSGLRQFITIGQLQAIRNKFDFKTYEQHEVEEIQFNLKQRGVNLDQKFEAIFVVYDPNEWENDYQQILDILRVDIKTPIYVVNNDYTYPDSFRLPRVAFGLFTAALRTMCMNRFGQEPNIIYYGKPTNNTFKYVENLIHQKNPNVGNLYMIGDNPKSDIRGANNIGWISILVRTGIFKGENDIVDPATYVVDDMQQAYELIKKLEDL